MLVSIKTEKLEVDKEIGNPSFLLSNKRGGYFSFSAENNISRFQGAYFAKECRDGWELFKVIEEIRLENAKPTRIICNLSRIVRESGSIQETFYLNHSNALVYEANNFTGNIILTLDCRKMYDFGDKGRIYSIKKEKDNIVITYTKYKDSRLKEIDYSFCIILSGIKEYEKTGSWRLKNYPFDLSRNSSPNELYVYDAMKIKSNGSIKIVFSYSLSKKEALLNGKRVEDNYEYLKKSEDAYVKSLTKCSLVTDNKEIIAAYKCCIKGLDDMIVDIKKSRGIYAGIPWFFQFWSRDEMVSLGALILEERYNEAKEILLRQLKNIAPDGRLSNRYPKSELESADSVGWMFFRLYEMMRILGEKKKLKNYLNEHDFSIIFERLTYSMTMQLKYHTYNALATNNKLETWMDTNYLDDYREGCRIEIQALRLASYKFMRYICNLRGDKEKCKSYARLEKETAKNVKEKFWHDPVLRDGINDSTIRPNIFLAYYVYPELLTRREWEVCFENALGKLWLEWGGLATIDKSHPLFTPNYTGENNKSYHRGDSWYYLNNIAAMCLCRVNKEKFKEYIDKILSAGANEILSNGFIGFHAELSSASKQGGEGCLAQSWSMATYIELVKELFEKKEQKLIHKLFKPLNFMLN